MQRVLGIYTFLACCITVAIAASQTSSGVYNCVDCEYTQDSFPSINQELTKYDTKTHIITYEQPKPVKLLIQNYSCQGCGLFEVSVRKTPRVSDN